MPEMTEENIRRVVAGLPLVDAAEVQKPKGGKGDAFAEINAFAWITKQSLNNSETGVWLSLWTRTDRKTGLAKVSLNLMSRDAGCSQRAAIYAVQSLMKKGLVKRVSKGSNLTNQPSVYRVYPTAKAEKG